MWSYLVKLAVLVCTSELLNIGQGDKVGSVKEKDNGYLSVA